MKKDSMEKTIEKARNNIPSAYALTIGEVSALYDASKESIIDALVKAYQFGFAKGTRAYSRKRVPVI